MSKNITVSLLCGVPLLDLGELKGYQQLPETFGAFGGIRVNTGVKTVSFKPHNKDQLFKIGDNKESLIHTYSGSYVKYNYDTIFNKNEDLVHCSDDNLPENIIIGLECKSKTSSNEFERFEEYKLIDVATIHQTMSIVGELLFKKFEYTGRIKIIPMAYHS